MADYPISDVPRRIVYTGSAGVGPYAFNFQVLLATDITVYKNDTELTLTTNYTVSISPTLGTGTITLVSAATGSDRITIVGARAVERTTDFTTGGDFFANTLNDELDSQTIFIQQVAETAERSIKAPVTDPSSINMTLPKDVDRANKTLVFDALGNPAIGQLLGTYRGAWASGQSYIANDYVLDSSNDNVYICNAAHTSSGTTPISSNADLAKWDLIIDAVAANASKVAAEAAQVAAELAETNAETAAINANTYASNAYASEINAATSATNAANSYDAFDDRYLGAKASAPSLDNDGNALITGALYWNTGNNSLYVWDGAAWQQAAFDVSGTGVSSFNTRTGAVTLSSADVTGALTYTPQASSANLDEFAAVNPTAAGLALLDDVDAAAQRTTLGLGAISTQGDGDKGDITVSASGATWTIDNDAVTFAKIQNITTSRLLGRATAGSGDAQEITLGSGVKFSSGALESFIPFRLRNLTTGTTYTPTADVVSFLACVYGAVGGRTGVQAGGRGGNGYSEKYYATPSGSYTYSIGAAGTTAGTAGGTTTFGVMSVTGSGGVTSNTGSAGGVGSGGDFNATGGTGGVGDGTRGGGGGGGASRAGNGGNGANQTGSTGGGGGGTGGNNASGATGGAAATVKAAGAYALPSNLFTGEYFDNGNTSTNVAGSTGSDGTSTFIGPFVIQLGSSGIVSGTTAGTTAAGEAGYITIVEFLQ